MQFVSLNMVYTFDVLFIQLQPTSMHMYVHGVYVSLVDSLLDVSKGSNVQRGVGQGSVHPGEADDGQEPVDQPYYQ